MTPLQAEIIVRLAENGLNLSATGKQIFLSRNTVAYHVKQIRKQTELDPRDFYDMCKLLPRANAVLAAERSKND